LERSTPDAESRLLVEKSLRVVKKPVYLEKHIEKRERADFPSHEK
jgi:hypothetical protein